MKSNRKIREFREFMNGRKVAVMGVGISNRPLIRYIYSLGADITAFDQLPENDSVLKKTRKDFEEDAIRIHWSCGENYLSRLESEDFELIFRTPKMRPDVPAIQKAVEKGAVLTSEMEVFMELCPARIFAVTGSDGKTTTTTLISKILESAGYHVFVGGNIGTPLLDQIDQVTEDDLVVLELSSFQLLTMTRSADVAVVTNVTPNHLDVHKDYQEYIDSKKNIFRNQAFGGRLVLNGENEITRKMASDARADVAYFTWEEDNSLTSCRSVLMNHVYVKNDTIMVRIGDTEHSVVAVRDIVIPGRHNVENYMAATAAVIPFVETADIEKVAMTFGGVEHRIELVRTLDGIRYYNSSIDTSPNRTINTMRALAARKERGVLIAGGADKLCDYTGLGNAILSVCDRIVLCGDNSALIRESLEKESAGREYLAVEVDNYPDAILKAKEWAREGEIVILSPVGTSYDKFRHFEERGNYFKELVNDL
jgi:UDP-N-acetylmuramoylalanine--D-glutamate ligase